MIEPPSIYSSSAFLKADPLFLPEINTMADMDTKLLSLGKVISKLNDTNYLQWKNEMRDHLLIMDLWTYTSTEKASESFTTDEMTKFNRNHLRTVAIMRSQMNERGYNLISDHTNAKLAWDEIKTGFTAKGVGHMNALYHNLVNITFTSSGNNAAQYTNAFRRAISELRRMSPSSAMEDNFLIYLFHAGLDSSFQMYRDLYNQTHEALTEDGLTAKHDIKYVMERFLNSSANKDRTLPVVSDVLPVALAAITDKTESNLKIQSGVQAGSVNSRIFSQMIKYCTHCKKDFHTIDECIKLHPELAALKRQRDDNTRGRNVNQSRGKGRRTGQNSNRTSNNLDYNLPSPSQSNAYLGYNGEPHECYISWTDSHSTLPVLNTSRPATVLLTENKNQGRGGYNNIQWRHNFSLPCFTRPTKAFKHSVALDTGCSQHAINDRKAFTTYDEFSQPGAVSGLGGSIQAIGVGTAIIFCDVKGMPTPIIFTNANYVPDIPLNLISYGQLEGKCPMKIIPGGFEIGNQGITALKHTNNLYMIKRWIFPSTNPNSAYTIPSSLHKPFPSTPSIAFPSINEDTLNQWHTRLGHLGIQNVQKLANMSSGIDLTRPIQNTTLCESCAIAQTQSEPHNNPIKPGRYPNDLIHSDVCGPLPEFQGHRYFVTFLCDKTKLSTIYLLGAKSGVFQAFQAFQKQAEHGQNVITRLRSDGGGEYDNDIFDQHRREHGITWEATVPGTPEQNGAAERLNQTLLRKASTMLKDLALDKKWWIELIKTANYLRNRSPVANLNVTPYEASTGIKPQLGHLKTIGTTGYAMLRKPSTGWKKFEDRSIKCLLIGYDGDHIYRMLTPQGKIYRASQVSWNNEKRQPTDSIDDEPQAKRQSLSLQKGYSQSSLSPQLMKEVNQDIDDNEVVLKQSRQRVETTLPTSELSSPSTSRRSSTLSMLSSQPDTESSTTPILRVLATRSRNYTIHQPRVSTSLQSKQPLSHAPLSPIAYTRAANSDALLAMASLSLASSPEPYEPKTLQEAMDDDKWTKWEHGMIEENESLNTNQTWELVPRPSNRKVLRGKWVYRLKRGALGEILRYKARWVVRGFEQLEGLDYHETFASVVKPMTYKALFAIAAANDWDIEQMDVKTAFLYGNIEEDIYVEQPDHFDDNSKRVCKLKKALYGLKQSPRVWYQTLATFLTSLGYAPLDSDFNVFSKHGTFLAIYVDDLIITGSSSNQITTLKHALSDRFHMANLGPCIYYLGMVISRDRPNRILALSQTAYIERVLKDHHMFDCKPMDTPMATDSSLHKAEDGYQASPELRHHYQSAVGSLMYIMLGTRPDIAYAISVVSRYGSNPTDEHWKAVKRIFRYLKATLHMRLTFQGPIQSLIGYTDSDWAGDKDTRRSTSGYVFSLGSAPISWSSKRQPTVALSTCEAEYTGQTQAAKEAVWLKSLLSQLTGDNQYLKSVVIYGDNQGAIALAQNPRFHARTKHIDIQNHYVRESIASKQVALKYIPTESQVADGLTKPLPRDSFQVFRKALCII